MPHFNLNERNLSQLVDKLSNLKGDYLVEWQRKRDIRSLSANRYYFGIVVKLIGEHIGESKEAVHGMLAPLFLMEALDLKNGKSEMTIRSTASLNSQEFEAYLEQCRNWSRETLDLIIPLPGEVTEEVYAQITNSYDRFVNH